MPDFRKLMQDYVARGGVWDADTFDVETDADGRIISLSIIEHHKEHHMSDDALQDVLSFDSMALAESLTGKGYKEDMDTLHLSLGLHSINNEVKSTLLKKRGDTTFSLRFEEHYRVYRDAGFQVIHSERFQGWDDANEEFYILWHADGILATLESFNSTSRNTAQLYYNVKPREGVDRQAFSRAMSSGGFTDGIWIGHQDAREAMLHKLERIREVGTFVNPWVERPFLWLLNYQESKIPEYDYAEINKKKIDGLSKEIQEAIQGQVN